MSNVREPLNPHIIMLCISTKFRQDGSKYIQATVPSELTEGGYDYFVVSDKNIEVVKKAATKLFENSKSLAKRLISVEDNQRRAIIEELTAERWQFTKIIDPRFLSQLASWATSQDFIFLSYEEDELDFFPIEELLVVEAKFVNSNQVHQKRALAELTVVSRNPKSLSEEPVSSPTPAIWYDKANAARILVCKGEQETLGTNNGHWPTQVIKPVMSDNVEFARGTRNIFLIAHTDEEKDNEALELSFAVDENQNGAFSANLIDSNSFEEEKIIWVGSCMSANRGQDWKHLSWYFALNDSSVVVGFSSFVTTEFLGKFLSKIYDVILPGLNLFSIHRFCADDSIICSILPFVRIYRTALIKV